MPKKMSAAPNRMRPSRSSKSFMEPRPSAFRRPFVRSPNIPLKGSRPDRRPVVCAGVPPPELDGEPADVGHLPLVIHCSTVEAFATRCENCAPPGWHPTQRSKLAAKLPAACAPLEPLASEKPPWDLSNDIWRARSAVGLPVTRLLKFPC